MNYKIERLSDRGDPPLTDVTLKFAFGIRGGNRSANINLRTCTVGANVTEIPITGGAVTNGAVSATGIAAIGSSVFEEVAAG